MLFLLSLCLDNYVGLLFLYLSAWTIMLMAYFLLVPFAHDMYAWTLILCSFSLDNFTRLYK
jgi:hypothetical protein